MADMNRLSDDRVGGYANRMVCVLSPGCGHRDCDLVRLAREVRDRRAVEAAEAFDVMSGDGIVAQVLHIVSGGHTGTYPESVDPST